MSHLEYFDYPGFGERVRKDVHYSQAVRIGDLIEISGQGGLDRTTEKFPTSLGDEIKQAFDNVEHALKQAGGKGWQQVYKINAYATDLDEKGMELFVEQFRKYCPNHQPLLTYLGVARLAFPEMHIEIQVSAHLR